MLSSVDLPAPDGPTIATNSPERTSKSTPLSTVSGFSAVPYVFSTSCSLRIVPFVVIRDLGFSPDHLRTGGHRRARGNGRRDDGFLGILALFLLAAAAGAEQGV